MSQTASSAGIQKTEPVKQVAVPPQVSRISLVDINEMADFLVGRITARHPDRTPMMLIGWLRGVSESNQSLFIRSKKAVGLFQLVQDFLNPPYVREVFVFCDPEYADNGAALYYEASAWAERFDAVRLEVMNFTDVEKADISMVIGTPKALPVMHVKLPTARVA